MPASRCCLTTSATAVSRRSSSACSSVGWPSMPAQIISTTSSGRGRLPACVVTIRSVLRGMAATGSDRPAERQSVLHTARRRAGLTAARTGEGEGTSYGEHEDGAWRAGATHAGRWCDVFEVRDFLIQRCFVYLDPDYAGRDTDRYPWLAAEGRDASVPLG